jgi:predicted acyltransferase
MSEVLKETRLTSLDVFRGATIAGMILVNNPGSWSYVYPQLRHADWHGWTFTDLIFPFFLFIVGVAIVFSFSRRVELGYSRVKLFGKVVRRTIILFALGLFLNGFPEFNFSTIRIMGVLQRIAICYFFASVIYLTSSVRWQAFWSFALLFIYWGLMEFVPVPGIGAGLYEKGRNFAAYVDSLILKGHMWSATKTWDPEGIVSTIPAISTTLFGVLTGHWLRRREARKKRRFGFSSWEILDFSSVLFGTLGSQ